jgi:putative lipoic acid-binding regulatory protein
MKEYLEFPLIYTFKIVGINSSWFEEAVRGIFADYSDVSLVINISSGSKYISISATALIKSYEELEETYTKISQVEGLKFHV